MRYVLLDRIVELEEGKRALGVKNVTMSEDFLTHHFPQYPVMPGMLIIEGMIQLASWLIAASTEFRQRAVIAGVRTAKFTRIVRPGEQLLLEVTIAAMDGEAADVKGVARVGEKRVTWAGFRVQLIETERLGDPAAARELFAILRG